MDKHTARRIYDTAIYLISCALSGNVADKDLIFDDVKTVFDISRHHSLNAIVTSALIKAGIAPDYAVTERNMAIRKIMLLDAGRAEILRELEASGIRYMVLKGVIIKELYPTIGDRQMSDNDILFDSCK